MFVTALGLSFLALLVLAGLRPDATRAYIDRTALHGASGVDLLAHHVLALPNQSMFVLVPAMGGCDRVQGTGEPRAFLCPSKFPRHGAVNLTAPLLPGHRRELKSPFADVRFGEPPAAFRLFLLVPLAAAVIGGVRAARAVRTRGLAAAAGGLAGVGFAALVVVGCLAAGITLRLYGAPPQQPVSVSILPDPVTGGLLGLAWGAVGGALGALAGWRNPLKNAPRAAPAAAAATPSATATPAPPAAGS